MDKKMDTKELMGYGCQINNNAVENVKESVIRLNDVMAMITDLQSINEALSLALTEADKEKENQEYEIEVLKDKICQFEKKEQQYNKLEVSSIQIANLLSTLTEREKKLETLEKSFSEEKKKFDQEKNDIIMSEQNAKERAKRLKIEKDKAIQDRDIAITEKDKAVSERDRAIVEKEKAESEKNVADREKEKIKNDLTEVGNELEKTRTNLKIIEKQKDDLTKNLEWYREYASAIDRKVAEDEFNKVEAEQDSGNDFKHCNNVDAIGSEKIKDKCEHSEIRTKDTREDRPQW